MLRESLDNSKSIEKQANRVLVVEAEDSIRETLVKVTTSEGYEVIAASDGHVALTLLQSLEFSQEKFFFDLIILAWVLPKVDGLELCRWLRHQGNFVPILVLDTKGSEADSGSVLEVGANAYLSKLFTTQDLIAHCRALLHRDRLSHLSESKVLRFEEVSLYPHEHRVIIRGKEVHLSGKEFGLLEMFMSYPHKIWSRQELFEQVWGPNFAGRTKTLDVHIRWLREKLELLPEQPKYIKTIPKVGYRFG
jgi:two-component system phosphate regulon response regulator PhoB